jgi:phospholipid N-methyltransferase
MFDSSNGSALPTTHDANARAMKVQESKKPGGAALLFARNFLRHPVMLGSIVPSSRFLVRRLLAPIDWSQARVIVEYGPGVGVVTRQILRNMRPDAALIVIETNPEFVAFLRSAIADVRLKVVQGSAANVVEILRESGYTGANYIVSGIPFSTMAPDVRERTLRDTYLALAPGGAFLVFQFSTRVLRDLRRIFRDVRRRFEFLNVLPAHLFICRAAQS